MPNYHEDFLSGIERYVQRKFQYKKEILYLLSLVEKWKLDKIFDDVLFLSKFLSQARIVLQREGSDSESTKKLTVEFAANLQSLNDILKSVIKEETGFEKEQFADRFLMPTAASLEQLLAFAKELAWIKNYKLDKTTE